MVKHLSMKAIKAVRSLPTNAAVGSSAAAARSDRLAALRTHQYSGKVCCSMVNGGFSTSTCCTTRARWPLRCRGPPQQGQTSRSVLLESGDLFGREGLAFVLGVAGLAADGTLGPVLKGGLGLDDVGGGWLGRGGGVLACRGEVFAQAREFRRDGVEFGLQRIHLRLQPSAVRTGFSYRFFHWLFYGCCQRPAASGRKRLELTR